MIYACEAAGEHMYIILAKARSSRTGREAAASHCTHVFPVVGV